MKGREGEKEEVSVMMILGKQKTLEFERGNARSNSQENSLWTCRKRDYTKKERKKE